MKIFVIGDQHGNTRSVLQRIDQAAENGCQTIMQVGDFGYWGGFRGVSYLDAVNAKLRECQINLFFVDGNHENHALLQHTVKMAPKSMHGHSYIRSNILYAPRGCVWSWGNKQFMSLGGAASIDREFREEGYDWWPEEMITRNDVVTAISNGKLVKGGVDYLFTHDASNRTSWGFQIIPDQRSMENRQLLDEVLNEVRPKMMFHGHMHKMYDWKLDYSLPFSDREGPFTQVYGLNMETERHAAGVLDTEENTFEFMPWKAPRSSVNEATWI